MTDDEIQSLIEGCIIQSSVEVKNLDHLGIVAGIVDELGVVEIVTEIAATVADSAVSWIFPRPSTGLEAVCDESSVLARWGYPSLHRTGGWESIR